MGIPIGSRPSRGCTRVIYTTCAHQRRIWTVRPAVLQLVRHSIPYLRDACRLIARHQNTVVVTTPSADELRKFQLTSLAQPEVQAKGFKPLPPGYLFGRS